MFEIQWYIIFLAFVLDFCFGDPAILPHPVIYMGKAIDVFEKIFRKNSKQLLASGFFFAVFLILSTFVITFLIIESSMAVHPVFGDIVKIILLFFCFSSTSLEKAALKVFQNIHENSMNKARYELSMIVGRQTRNLDENAVTSAAVETVAENFVDGFLAPLFFAFIGGIPLAITYKMVNTLDSMVGYKNDKYILFGRAAARIDDIANFIPARLSVLIISLSAACFSISKGILSFKLGFFQGHLHKSPNAGYPEAAFAGALKIRIGGPNLYYGVLVDKPYIGKEFKEPAKSKIKDSCDLMMLSSFFATLIFCLASAVFFGVR